MNAPALIEYKVFMMNANEDKILNYGDYLLTVLIVYQYLQL